MKWTNQPPNEEGHYWYLDKDDAENTPCVLKVIRDKHGFFAFNHDFNFVPSPKSENEFWCFIPEPLVD